jgi:hypothetical protein
MLPATVILHLLRAPLLRSFRPQDWINGFRGAGLEHAPVRGPMFDSSLIMVLAAMRGEGVALAPYGLFRREIDSGQIVRPFAIEIDVDGYWLTRLKSRAATPVFTTKHPLCWASFSRWTPSAWSPAASASTSTASGTRPPQPPSQSSGSSLLKNGFMSLYS